jgi:hypothetical protein
MVNLEMLMASERSPVFLKLQRIGDHLTLEGENRRLNSQRVKLNLSNSRLYPAHFERDCLPDHRMLLQTLMSEPCAE